MRLVFLLLLAITTFNLTAQKNSAPLTFQLNYKGEELKKEKSYFNSFVGDSLKINTLEFYISNLSFKKENGQEIKKEKAYLLDLSKPSSFVLDIVIPDSTETISFFLGIDSITNVSGAMGGDLDPTKGMYWSWQSGYINFKLEGTSPACLARKNKFQYHLGGYSFPYKNVQQIKLSIKDKGSPTIQIDFYQFFNAVKVETQSSIMSPSEEAVQLSQLIAKLFSVKE